MKAITSATYDHNYLFFLPITAFCWNKLGVNTYCFVPVNTTHPNPLLDLVLDEISEQHVSLWSFTCPKNKEATYAQCSRLFAAALTGAPDDEVYVTTDVDMLVFKEPPHERGTLTIYGADLVPQGQYPMCYASAERFIWRKMFGIDDSKNLQQCLDELLGGIEAENFRGNYWAKDQEELHIAAKKVNQTLKTRAREGTQFARNRIDRDDAYFMDRLNFDVFDYHAHRPGYTDENFEKMIAVIQYFYPYEDLSWMRRYQQSYKALL